MGWTVKFPDGPTVDIDDLTVDEFQTIAKDDPDGWFSVYNFPAKTMERLDAVIEACALHAGLPSPGPSTTVREFKARFDSWLEATPDIEDEPMNDGFPPTPDAPEIGSSSGTPGASDGLSTSPEDSPSTTS